MLKQLVFGLLCSLSLPGISQDSVFVDLSSPFGAVKTHLYYLQEDHFRPGLAAIPFKRDGIGQEQAEKYAIQLKQIFDGEGTYIEFELLPKNPAYYDSLKKKQQFLITEKHPQVYLERVNGEWYYSQKSIAAIQELHDEVYPFGTDILLELLPKLGTQKIMGLHLYQYIGILILILISVIIHKVLTYMFERFILQVLLKAGYEKLADRFLLPVARPISIFVTILLLVIFLPVIQIPPDISRYIIMGLKALLPLFGTIVFYRIVDVICMYLAHLAEKTESTLDDQLVPLLRKTLKTFVVAIGTLFVLQTFNIPILPLLTGLSIGGLAFALAAQDTIKNFFGSLMIFVDRPFQIGDWITSGEIDGSVEEVGFRSSRIRTFRNSLMYVPNSKLADSTIDNHGMRQYRRFYTQIAVTYDTPAELIETFVQGLRKIVENHPDTRKDYFHIYFNDMASFSLNIMFYIFFEVPDWPAELKSRHEILLEIIKLAKKLGVNFAFPTQTLHMENFPGQPSLTPSYMGKDEMELRLGEFMNQPPKN